GGGATLRGKIRQRLRSSTLNGWPHWYSVPPLSVIMIVADAMLASYFDRTFQVSYSVKTRQVCAYQFSVATGSPGLCLKMPRRTFLPRATIVRPMRPSIAARSDIMSLLVVIIARMTSETGFPKGIGAPAIRVLIGAGYIDLRQ